MTVLNVETIDDLVQRRGVLTSDGFWSADVSKVVGDMGANHWPCPRAGLPKRDAPTLEERMERWVRDPRDLTFDEFDFLQCRYGCGCWAEWKVRGENCQHAKAQPTLDHRDVSFCPDCDRCFNVKTRAIVRIHNFST